MQNKDTVCEQYDYLRPTQEKVYALLKAFKQVCEKHDIWYSLYAGTVLGAVRHHGFIPWDTDADVVIMLPDKERFRAAWEEEKGGYPGIALKNHSIEKTLQSHDTLYYSDAGPDTDLHLDIFPLCGAPSEKKEQERFASYSKYADKILRSKYVNIRLCKKKNRPLVFGAKLIDYLIPDALLRKNIKNRETKYSFDDAEYLITLSNYGSSRACIRKSLWQETVPERFEDDEFAIPKDWDQYLTITYGADYMTPKKY